MPTVEAIPNSTTVVAAGWNNPTNAYVMDGTYANTTTTTAEQSYSGYNPNIGGGGETIDKVFIKIKQYISYAKAGAGDSGAVTCTLKVYDGSTWTSYTVNKLAYTNTTPAVDATETFSVGDDTCQITYIDVTSILNTYDKLRSAQTALLFTINTAGAGLTPTWYVDAVNILVSYSPSSVGPLAITARDIPHRPKRELEAIEKALHALTVT